MNRLGECLRRWRKEAKLNQETVAQRVGVGQSTISAAENGKLSAQLLHKLVNLYAPPAHEVGEAMMLPRAEDDGLDSEAAAS